MTQPINNGQAILMQTESRPFRIEETDGIVRLYLHGEFHSVEDNTKLMSDLYALSERYNNIEVWISSDGGLVTILTEIIEALRTFRTVVTICNSNAGSAAAFIWSLGDIRVVSPYASLMWHRESYGFFGKTNQHEDTLEQQKKIFPLLIEYCVGEVLTEEDKTKALYTEVLYSGQDMIDSGHAISFQDYRERLKDTMTSRFTELGLLFYDNVRGTTVLADDQGMIQTVGHAALSSYRYSLFDVGVSNHIRVLDEDSGQMVFFSHEQFEEMEAEFFDEIDAAMADANSAKEDEEEDEEHYNAYFDFVLSQEEDNDDEVTPEDIDNSTDTEEETK